MPRACILVITNGQLSRNPRPLKEARALGAAGYDVTVLLVRNHAEAEQHDTALLRDAPFRRECVDVLPGFGTSRVVVTLRRARIALARRAAGTPNGRKTIHSLGPAAALLRRARAFPADLTIVHNEVPHWVGGELLAAGRQVAADIEDWHSEDLLPADRAARPLDLLRANERTLLQRTAYTSTTSEALAAGLHASYGGRRPEVIANAFPLQPLPADWPDAAAAEPAFFWFSQTLGPGRGLGDFLPAWSAMRTPTRLVLLGATRDDFKAALLASLPEAHRSRVSFLPLVAPDDLPDVIARHDIGLALEERSIRNRDLTITNKILQYLNAGLAVVATPTAGQREVLARQPAAGLLLPESPATPGASAALLDGFVADRAALIARRRAARQLAEAHYCWEKQAPHLLQCVERALAARA